MTSSTLVDPQPRYETQADTLAESSVYKSGPLIFDIETGALDEKTIRSRSIPFQAPPHPGQFDQKAVKVGNLKDPDKIAAKYEEARKAHTTLVENYAADCQRLEKEYWANIIDRAALSPLLGRVVAIGLGLADGGNHYLCINGDSDEAEFLLLDLWWTQWCMPCVEKCYNMIGHNILEFDVPFLIRRSWLLGVDIPENVMQGRFLSPFFIDTSNVWRCGSRSAEYIKLDHLAKALGVGGKVVDETTGEAMSGADFARLYFGTSEERGRALDYLAGDVDVTRKVARRLGLV